MSSANHLYIIYSANVEGYASLHALDQSYPPFYLDINLQK